MTVVISLGPSHEPPIVCKNAQESAVASHGFFLIDLSPRYRYKLGFSPLLYGVIFETIRRSRYAAMDEASIGHSSHCSLRVLSRTTNRFTGRIFNILRSPPRPLTGSRHLGRAANVCHSEHPPSSLGLVTTRVPCMLHRTHQVTNQLAAPICPIFLHLVSTRSVSFLASPRRTFDSLHKKFIGTVYVPARHSPYGWRCE